MDAAEINLPRLDTAALLRAHDLSPRKGLGQNFLVDDAALRRVIQAADISPDSTVLEVGPGLGHLTRYLARSAGKVVAVELDRNLIPVLQEVLGGAPNVQVVQGDILELDLGGLIADEGYLVVANIPYNITGPLIQRLLEARLKPARLVLTIQKEVAQAICAGPGDLSIRALSVQVYGMPRILATIPAAAFFPAPEVDSAVLRIDLYPEPLVPASLLGDYFRLVKAGFSQKRKTLRNSLAGGLAWKPERTAALLESAGIDPQRRAETVSLGEWNTLVSAFREAQ
ncbi:MAG TPA: 16S rRNA (adenine(1518)-N(6)/adenine(1519)-N(6))-dimethyltransferase RsmA [Anaerolineaceae bacterium]|nr:16S rRNA (adenine(1518)-N(6)/adenine(1519)-N(6))-dimethyltransferase RsmA [Anaerolineaceae bacterium]